MFGRPPGNVWHAECKLCFRLPATLADVFRMDLECGVPWGRSWECLRERLLSQEPWSGWGGGIGKVFLELALCLHFPEVRWEVN